MPHPIQGVLPIAHTPFTADGGIDWTVLRGEIDWIFQQGADGFGTGMVSELLRLAADERDELHRRLAEYCAGRGAFFASVGAESTRQAVAFAQAAQRAGADAVMAAPPVSSALPVGAVVDYFRHIAEAVELPLIVQDASSYVGREIPIPVCVELLDRYGAQKILFKPEAAPFGPRLSALRDATGGEAAIFEGSGGVMLVDAHRRGIAGTMPGTDLLDGIVAIWRALEHGDEDAAYRVYFPLCALVNLQMQAGLDGFLAIEKYLLARRGVFPSERRREPFGWELDPETAAEVDRLFARLQTALQA